MALVAWSLFSISFLMCCSARSLFDGGDTSGVSGGSYPRRIWLGNNPVMVFLLLLCTAEARASHCIQSSGFADVTILRYCSTCWFFLSKRPSIWGWNAIKIFWLISSFIMRAFPNWEVNLGSLSEMILVGSPNQGYMFRKYNWAMSGLVIVVEHGRKIATLEQPWSTIVSIKSFPFTWGKPVIRSIAICENGLMFGVVVILKSGVFLLWVWILFYWQVVHPLT